jgi:hypothetical protein
LGFWLLCTKNRYSGLKVGKLISVLGQGRSVLTVNHCTVPTNGTGETGIIQWGETNKGLPSGCDSLRSNIAFSLNPWGSGYYVQKTATGGGGTGSVLVGSGIIAVTGTSTSFSTFFAPGDFIQIGNGSSWDAKAYQIQTVNSNTLLTLFNPYDGGYTGAGRSYRPFVQDYIASSSYIACNFNAGWNLSDGTDGYGYNSDILTQATKLFSYTPGINDIILNNDPFYDSSRNIATWAISKGVATTGMSYDIQVSSAYDYIKGSISGRIADLTDWVKQGWSVVNPVLYNAGHDGITIGALPYISTSGSNISYQIILVNAGFGRYLIKAPA